MSKEAGTEPTPVERRAVFRVVRGEPSDAELAALTVVLAAVAGAGQVQHVAAPPPDMWSDPAARLRVPLAVGPGSWRTSHWPR